MSHTDPRYLKPEFRRTLVNGVWVPDLCAHADYMDERAARLEAQNRELVEALRAWEHWYSEDSSEFARDTARELGRRLIARATGPAAKEPEGAKQ